MPDECLRLLAGADLVLHAGDFVSAQFLEELRRIGPPVEGGMTLETGRNPGPEALEAGAAGESEGGPVRATEPSRVSMRRTHRPRAQ